MEEDVKIKKMKAMSVKIKAIRGIQNNNVMYTGFLDSDLISRYVKFDIHNPRTNTGYNRDDKVAERADNFEDFLDIPNNFSPTSIILNDRSNTVRVHSIRNSNEVELEFTDKSELFAYDGQSRSLAFMNMFKKQSRKEDSPFVLTKTDKAREIINCSVINNKQTRTKSNQEYAFEYNEVISLLKQKNTNLSGIPRDTLITGIGYNIIMTFNNKKDSFLKDYFIMAGEDPQPLAQRIRYVGTKTLKFNKINHKTITLSSHLHKNNLRRFIEKYLDKYLSKYNNFTTLCNDIFEIVNNFWESIREVNPLITASTKTIYKKNKDTEELSIVLLGYHTLRSNGCFVFYPLLKHLFFVKNIKTKEEFVKALSRSDTIKNSKFWEENKMNRSLISNSYEWSNAKTTIYEEMFPK